MRYVEIDGKRYDVSCCEECPCYDGGDMGYMSSCKHPEGNGVPYNGWWNEDEEVYGPYCPLREKPEPAEGGFIDPSKSGPIILDPPESNGEKETVVPEHTLKEMMGYKWETSDKDHRKECTKDDPELEMIRYAMYTARNKKTIVVHDPEPGMTPCSEVNDMLLRFEKIGAALMRAIRDGDQFAIGFSMQDLYREIKDMAHRVEEMRGAEE